MVTSTNPEGRPGQGSGCLTFTDQVGSHVRLRAFYYLPERVNLDRAPLFVFHGVKRNADLYRDTWIKHARTNRTLLIAPEFCRQQFPGSGGYNLGNLHQDDSRHDAIHSAFGLVERLFSHVRSLFKLTSNDYLAYGHSAGAQFVHRLILFHPSSRVRAAVAANAGWYTLPTYEQAFPYGLGNTACSHRQLKRALQKRMTILVGAEDVDTRDPMLRSTVEAMQQGANRLQRGFTKHAEAVRTSKNLNARCNWQLKTVEGVGHSNRLMAKPAASILFATD